MAELDQDPPLPRLQQEIRPQDPPQRSGLSSLPHSSPSQRTHHQRAGGTPFMMISTIFHTFFFCFNIILLYFGVHILSTSEVYIQVAYFCKRKSKKGPHGCILLKQMQWVMFFSSDRSPPQPNISYNTSRRRLAAVS
jgi:hypothetical protein